MKYLALISFSVLLLWACTPTSQLSRTTPQKDNYKDRLEEGSTQVGFGYNYSMEQTDDGRFLYKVFYPSTGQMTQRFTYADKDFKIRQGLAVERFDNGELWKQGRYVNNQMDGEWQFYSFRYGTLSEYGNYEAGKREGTWTRVDSAGALLSTYQYENDQLHGPFKVYRPAGVLFKEGVYERDALRLEKVVGEESDSPGAMAMPEEMPYMSGCANEDKKEEKRCSELKMLTTIYQNIRYPAMARENDIMGTAYIYFVVKKDGSLADLSVMRGICDEIKEECLRVVQLLPPWEPGRQNAEPVNVEFTLPIKFKLE